MPGMENGVVSFEISTDNPVVVEHFYESVFSWSFTEGHGRPYGIISTPSSGSLRGGFWDNTMDERGRNWAIFCVQVRNVTETCEKAVAAGGKVLFAPEASTGDDGMVFAHLLDPSDNHFGVFSRPESMES